jgi:hypothetical protein
VILVALQVLLAVGGPGTAGAVDWSVKTIPGTDAHGTRCVLESASQSLSDGYQTTTARITVDKASIKVTSASNLDESFRDIALVVDRRESVPADGLAGEKTALFDSKYSHVVEQFKEGARVRVQLRFWPTWPATGLHSVTFSLIGFTRGYGELSACP